MKKTWKIDVPSCEGYSFAVVTDIDNDTDVITAALKADLFDDPYDSKYASAEDITGDAETIKAFKDCTYEL